MGMLFVNLFLAVRNHKTLLLFDFWPEMEKKIKTEKKTCN